MPPNVARLALRQTGLTEVLGAIAYVEGFALVVAGLGVAIDPVRTVRGAASLAIVGKHPWSPIRRSFPAHVRLVARAVMAERLRVEASSRVPEGRGIADVRMSVAQVGDLAGVGELAHHAGELMVFQRTDDSTMLHVAVTVCDALRLRLEAISRTDGGEDTAPIIVTPHAASAGAVVAPVKDGPTFAARPLDVRDEPTPRGRRPHDEQPR